MTGHNDPSHFGNLKQLHEGDAVFFEDADGNRFHDEVAEIEILSPDAVEEMAEGDGDRRQPRDGALRFNGIRVKKAIAKKPEK